MTNSTEQTLPVVNRSVPQDVVDLLGLALELGFDEVGISHLMADQDAQLQSPVGWFIHMYRRSEMCFGYEDSEETQPAEDEQALRAWVRLNRSHDGVVSTSMEINVGDSFDLTVQDAKEWMLSTDHEGVGVFEQTPVVIHPEGSPKRLALRADLDTMVDAMNNGWGSIRKIRREGHISLLQTSVKLCIKNNRPFTPRPFVASIAFEWMNPHYNERGHAGHRDNGTQSTMMAHIVRNDAEVAGPWDRAIRQRKLDSPDDHRPMENITVDELWATIAQTPPFHEQVSYYQDVDPEGDEEFGDYVI